MTVMHNEFAVVRGVIDWLESRVEHEPERVRQTLLQVNAILRSHKKPRVTSTLQWRSDVRDEALGKIRGTLEKAGITFLPESAHGVGLRGRQKS